MDESRQSLLRMIDNIGSVVRGKDDVVRLAVIGLLARGHLLFEDVPGVGKTTLARCLSRSISCSFQPIQFTSDLMPSDIIGVSIFNSTKQEFEFKPGPLFASMVLADEINRTTPKTQSSLLEAMNTGRVSVDRTTYDLPQPFSVIATQNPIEFHGTFPLPKSQMDRFLMRLRLGYPESEDELTVLSEQKTLDASKQIEPVLQAEDVCRMQDEVEAVSVEESLLDYVVRIAQATRQLPEIELGVSVRGSLALRRAAQARAYLEGRDFVTPDDVKQLVVPTLAHRIQVASTFENGGFGAQEDEECLISLMKQVEAPV